MVTGNITVVGGDTNTKAAFDNCHPFIGCKIHLNGEHVKHYDNLDIIMNMYNLIEYSDNYEDSTASLYYYNANLTGDGSSSFKYKSSLLGNATEEGGNAVWKNAQIIVPLKYISSFFRSLELLLINTKLYIQLNYTEKSVIPTDATDSTTFKIVKTDLYVPVVTLNTEDNDKLNQLLLENESTDSKENSNNKFKRTVHWNEYKSKIENVTQPQNNTTFKRTLLDTAIPGVNRLFVAAFPTAALRNSHRQYFLPTTNIREYNILTDGRNFYYQNISDDFKKYEELRKVMTGKGEDYTTGSLLEYEYWKNNYKLICLDFSKQKVLDTNPRPNQQVEFVYKLGDNDVAWVDAQILTVLEK